MAGGAAEVIAIRRGWRPGLLGRIVALHAEYYARAHGFGVTFECTVADGLADFGPRLERARNGLWTAADHGGLVGSIAIDGEDLGDGSAHLRWFIVADRARGTGLGRRLLEQALAFCDAQGFACTQLWTFDGLHAARRLYAANGFVLAEQWPGTQWGPLVQEQRFERTRP
jgi:GNAT superfamily N-acetyltransferase